MRIFEPDPAYSLFVVSDSIGDDAELEEYYRKMKDHGIRRGLLIDMVGEFYLWGWDFRNCDLRLATYKKWCVRFGLVVLIPEIRPIFRLASWNRKSHIFTAFRQWLIDSQVPFLGLDMPEVSRDSLVKIEMKARKGRAIDRGLMRTKWKGTKLGNPRLGEAQEKARAAHDAARPSKETLSLIRELRRGGKSLREIARALNEINIKPARGKRWYASSIRNILKSFDD
jgi:Recombinase